jgi:putative modified peptide
MATKKGAGAQKQAAPLDPKVADRLLDLLSTDNEFRRLFKKDPQAALVKAGWKPPKAPVAAPVGPKVRKGPPFTPPGPPEMAPPFNCLKVARIAPKETISQSRASLKAFLTSELTMQPIQLNVATTASRRSRK